MQKLLDKRLLFETARNTKYQKSLQLEGFLDTPRTRTETRTRK